MMSKKNFYIILFYLNGKCIEALSIMKKDTKQFWRFAEKVEDNEAGGVTWWFRIDIDPEYKKFIPPYR